MLIQRKNPKYSGGKRKLSRRVQLCLLIAYTIAVLITGALLFNSDSIEQSKQILSESLDSVKRKVTAIGEEIVSIELHVKFKDAERLNKQRAKALELTRDELLLRWQHTERELDALKALHAEATASLEGKLREAREAQFGCLEASLEARMAWFRSLESLLVSPVSSRARLLGLDPAAAAAASATASVVTGLVVPYL